MSSGETQPLKLPPKRRRILDPSAIVPVPVYSNKVNSSLQLRAPALDNDHNSEAVTIGDTLWKRFLSEEAAAAATIALSDSDNDTERKEGEPKGERDAVRSPSPPPPQNPAHKPSRKAARKISEINRRLQVVNSLLSPDLQSRRPSRRGPGRRSTTTNDDNNGIIIIDNDRIAVNLDESDDDVIAITPGGSPHGPSIREIPLKVRCRTDVHKIHVLSSTPLSSVLAQLSVKLRVPTPRLLLMREEVELPVDSTIGDLGLGIADIIECVVMAAQVDDADSGVGVITVRLQTKDRDSVQEFSLHREAALGSVFSQYLSLIPAGNHGNVRFHFDGGKVMDNQTPAQLDMEDGDIIEVWI